MLSSSWARIARGSTVCVNSRIRSASVDLPWSMWAMIEKFRIRSMGSGPVWRGHPETRARNIDCRICTPETYKFDARRFGRAYLVPVAPALALLTALTAFASPATPGHAATPQRAPAPCHGCWHPHPTTTPWQWQLQGRTDLSVKARVYDIDMGNPASVVDRIHSRGARAVCYVDVGSW